MTSAQAARASAILPSCRSRLQAEHMTSLNWVALEAAFEAAAAASNCLGKLVPQPENEGDVPIERIEPHVGIDIVDRCPTVTSVRQNTGHHQMSVGRVGRQCEAAPRLGKCPVVLAMKKRATASAPWAWGSASSK